MEDNLRVEWDKDNVYIVLGPNEIKMSRAEAEGLFVTLGNGLQDMDILRNLEEIKIE